MLLRVQLELFPQVIEVDIHALICKADFVHHSKNKTELSINRQLTYTLQIFKTPSVPIIEFSSSSSNLNLWPEIFVRDKSCVKSATVTHSRSACLFKAFAAGLSSSSEKSPGVLSSGSFTYDFASSLDALSRLAGCMLSLSISEFVSSSIIAFLSTDFASIDTELYCSLLEFVLMSLSLPIDESFDYLLLSKEVNSPLSPTIFFSMASFFAAAI